MGHNHHSFLARKKNSVDEEEKNKMDDNASGILRCGILLDAFCFQRTFIITSRPRKQKKRVTDVSEKRTHSQELKLSQLSCINLLGIVGKNLFVSSILICKDIYCIIRPVFSSIFL